MLSKPKFMPLRTCCRCFITALAYMGVAYSPNVLAQTAQVVHMQSSSSITGNVKDYRGEPLIGATVVIKGTTNAVVTDLDGNFIINNVKGGSVITVSYIGFKTYEGKATLGAPMNIVLSEDSELLDEVVVVGYGTQKRETLSGSIAVVDNKIFKDRGTTSNPLSALQGAVPGTVVTRTSSAPGEEGWNISVRGAVSRNSGGPLVIIDGVPTEGTAELSQLNSSDIESMNFLKDASAAIYGSKAASGVILITTKKAKEGRIKVEYNGSVTRKIVGLQDKLMNYDQWCEGVMQVTLNDNLGTDYVWYRYAQLAQEMRGGYLDFTTGKNPLEPIPGVFTGVRDMVFQDVDWEEVMWKNAWSTQHDLSLSGGSERFTYRISLGYLNDQSTLRWGNNSNERFNFRLNNTIKATDRLTINSIISASRRNQVAPTRISNALSSTPVHVGFPVSTVDGKPYVWGSEYGPNWLAELGGDNKLVSNRVSINEIFEYRILEGLNLNASIGYSHDDASRDRQWLPIDWYIYNGTPAAADKTPYPRQEDSFYEKGMSRTEALNTAAYLSYSKTLGNHEVGAMAGVQYDYMKYERSAVQNNDIQPALGVLNGSGAMKVTDARKYEEASLSYYSRLNYNWKKRYLLEGTMRYDGSSKFRPDNRWAFFYGVSGAWRFTEEAFLRSFAEKVGDMKLRLSYGQVGNQSGIDRYDGIQFYEYVNKGGAFLDGEKVSYISEGSMASTEREWERIHNYNVGLDINFFNNRLSGSADLFMKRNNNMLISQIYSGVLGTTAPSLNRGKFESHGWEGQLTWRDQIGNVSYHIGGSMTYFTNKLKSGGTDVISAGFNSAVNGYPLNSIFSYRYVGKIQNEMQLKKYTDRYLVSNSIGMPANLRLGDNVYEDVNGDGKLTQDDMIYLGTDDPKFSFSFDFGLEWKGFDMSVAFQGAGKRTVCRPADSYKIPFKTIYRNTSAASYGNVWSKENPNGHYPTYSNQTIINDYNYIVSTWYVEDGAYIRLKNISLGYTMPKRFYDSIRNVLSNLRIYVSGADLWEHSKINDGWDPEASRTASGLSRYPFNRTVTFGLNASF